MATTRRGEWQLQVPGAARLARWGPLERLAEAGTQATRRNAGNAPGAGHLRPKALAVSLASKDGLLVGAVAGALHGGARALGVVANVVVLDAKLESAILTMVVWRVTDGLWLLLVGSVLVRGLFT